MRGDRENAMRHLKRVHFVRSGLLIAVIASLSLAAQESGQEAGPDEAPADGPKIQELTQEELDAEMERVEQALGKTGELKEFVPTKPLAADLPVALPSDI
jgi:hypothetical protein